LTDEEKSGLKTDPVCLMEVREEEAICVECDGVMYRYLQKEESWPASC